MGGVICVDVVVGGCVRGCGDSRVVVGVCVVMWGVGLVTLCLKIPKENESGCVTIVVVT